MRRLGLVIIIVVAMKGQAATSYRLDIHRDGWPQASSTSVKVTVDGSNVRADFERPPNSVVTHDTALSRDGGKTFLAVNSELRTWFRMDASPFVLHLRALPVMTGKPVVRNVEWSTSRSQVETPGGPTYAGQLSYVVEERFEDVRVRIKRTAVVRIWSTPALDARLWPARVPLMTGIPEIDTRIASSVELLGEFPERIVLVATTKYEGGSPSTETFSVTIAEMQSLEDVAPGFFELPRGYVEQKPIIAAPGR